MGNREDLLAGARRCLLAKGYERTTVRDIATEAGVSMAAIGYHFGSREALLTAAMVQGLEQWSQQVEKAFSEEANTDPAHWFVAIWPKLIESMIRDRPLWAASIEAFNVSEHQPELREMLTYGQRLARRGLASHLSGIGEDAVPDPVVRTIGSVQLALFVGIQMQWLQDPEWAPTSDEIIEGVRAIAALLPPKKD